MLCRIVHCKDLLTPYVFKLLSVNDYIKDLNMHSICIYIKYELILDVCNYKKTRHCLALSQQEFKFMQDKNEFMCKWKKG